MTPPDESQPGDAWKKHYHAGLKAVEERRVQDAEVEFRAALVLAEGSGEDDPRLLESLDALAYTYSSLGRLTEAEQQYRRLLMIQERLLGPESQGVTLSLGWLAKLCSGQGKHSEAAAFACRRLAIRQAVWGPEHPLVAETHDSLVGPCLGQRKLAEAVGHYRAALALREKTLGPKHREVADSLVRLAGLIGLQDADYKEAEQLWRRAADIYERLYQRRATAEESEFRHIAMSLKGTLENLACRAYHQQHDQEAERLFRRVMEVSQDRLGNSSGCGVLRNLPTFAEVLVRRKKYEEAEQMLQNTIAQGHRGPDGDEFRRTACLKVLAKLYVEVGRYAEAESLFERTIRACETNLSRHGSTIVNALHGYAELCRRLSRDDEAARLEARAQAIQVEGDSNR